MFALQEKDYSLYMRQKIWQICISEKIISLKWKGYLKPSMVQGIEMKKIREWMEEVAMPKQ